MPSAILRTFDDRDTGLRSKILTVAALLVGANVAVWTWALAAFHDYPVLLGTCFLAYSFGLRHAVDADHLAAIDNVTRKLMQEGKRPLTAGFFFSLGHSSVVVLASIGIAATAVAFRDELEDFHALGGTIGVSVSAAFLLLIAAINTVILLNVYRAFQRVKNGADCGTEELDALLTGGGVLTRILRRLFRLIGKSWHMYPLGFLFGLGFDTATEVGLLGIAAAQGSSGLPIWSILVFPALFTAGMALVDTADSVLMVGAYGWAFVKPVRKLYYNLTITFVSVIVAVVIGGIEALGLVASRFGLTGGLWEAVESLNDTFGMLGYLIIGIFALSWVVSLAVYHIRGYDRIEVGSPAMAQAASARPRPA